MTSCDECEAVDKLCRSCEHCGQVYCPDHTLPENHNCAGFTTIDVEYPDGAVIGETESLESGGHPDEKSPTETKVDSTVGDNPGTPAAPEYESSPDVNLDGSLQSEDRQSQANGESLVSRLKQVFTGIRTSGRYYGACPHCDGYTGRPSRITECDNCGWRPGLPVLRYRKYPRWELIIPRSKSIGYTLIKAAFVTVLGAILLSAVFGVSIPGISGAVDSGFQAVADASNESDSEANGAIESSGVNETTVERQIHEEINDRRAEQGLSRLAYDPELSEIAQDHSQDMSDNDYVGHTGSDGSDFRERYQQAGYDCRVETTRNTYALGGENIAQTWYQERLDSGDYYTSTEELAIGIVEQWMNSPGHRDNILKEYWQSEGIGVIIAGDKVYATQNFC